MKPKNMRGQSLVELVFIIPVFVFLISGIFWFTRTLITKQQLVTASRYGTDLILYTRLNERQIRQEIRNYLCDRDIEGRKLNINALPDDSITVSIKEFRLPKIGPPMDLFDGSILNELLRSAETLAMPENGASFVHVKYEIPAPAVIRSLSRFISGNEFRESIVISGHSEVLAGTGCENRIHTRNR